jgi:hypothetical protein
MSEHTAAELYLASTKRYLSLPKDPEEYVVAFAKLREEWEKRISQKAMSALR